MGNAGNAGNAGNGLGGVRTAIARDPAGARPPMTAMPPAPDAETLARATLTFCLDGADALMYALIKGAGSAGVALDLILESRSGAPGANAAGNRLDQLFALGLARWGRKVGARGMGVFHRSLDGWRARLDALPTDDWRALAGWFTMDGRQWIIAPHTPYWPMQLQDLSTRSDWAAPLCLWGIGDATSLTSCDQPLAVVGSRDATDYGRGVARDIAARAAADGHLIVSGGAMGADAAAHWGALSVSDVRDMRTTGRTVAVFAGGLNHVGPLSNARLFDTIVARGGALISELCPGTIPEGRRFLLRNRIIAALSAQVVVVQARMRSGALNTAGWGCDLNRLVAAVPGLITTPHNAGCNQLIADAKAILLTSVEEITGLVHAPHRPRCADTDPACHTGREGDAGETGVEGAATGPGEGTAAPVAPSIPASASGDGDGAHPTRKSVIAAIRSCAHRRMPTTPDALLTRLKALDPSAPVTMPLLLARLGDMESAGMIRVDDGTVTLQAALHADPRPGPAATRPTGSGRDPRASRPPLPDSPPEG
ncbi:DNA-processing protein DprA [Bifidobacterium rousetti]|uniref:DNA-processing protein DprA n=1 Tax=Bifidobacterium rousetti TaxID=2045439 RepID=UPI001CC29DCA|nr:DNA-processing protein DprA [Bifidobacterium rousetti]